MELLRYSDFAPKCPTVFIFSKCSDVEFRFCLYAADPDNQNWSVHVGEQKHLSGVLCPLGPAEQS